MGRVVLRSAGAALLALVGLELALRSCARPSALLDRHGECFWIVRMHERLQRADGERELENVVRDPVLGWRMRPGHAGGGERMDSNGARSEREIPLERRAGLRRLVALGDSFTFGLGVANGETFVDRLALELEALETVNLGVNGYGTDQQVLCWEELGARYSPDAVLLGFFVPDFHRNALSVRELPKPRFRLEGASLVLDPGPLPEPRALVERRLAGCRSALRLRDLAGALRRLLVRAEPEGPFEEKAALLAGILARLRDSTRADGARLALVVLPEQRFRGYPDHARIVRAVETACRSLGTPLLDLTEPLESWQREHPEEPLFDPSEHWTPRAHALAARWIAAFLVERGVL